MAARFLLKKKDRRVSGKRCTLKTAHRKLSKDNDIRFLDSEQCGTKKAVHAGSLLTGGQLVFMFHSANARDRDEAEQSGAESRWHCELNEKLTC